MSSVVFEEIINPLFVYSLAVITLTLFILFWGLRRLRREENKRVKTVKKMDITEAVETDVADDDVENITRRQAVSSIESRFDLIRKTFIPLVIGIAVILLAMPLLPVLSASYITLIAGAFAVLLGLAAKPFIENAISGVVITLSQPIRIGDTVIMDGRYGTIERINLLYTVVKVWNWRRYIVPNHRLLQKEFENLTQNDEMEWAHVEFTVAPGSDLEKVKIIAKAAMQSRYLMNTEAPSFWVMELNKDAIICWVAGWASNPAEGWALRSLTRKRLAESLKQEDIPFQMVQNRVEVKKQN